MDYLHGNVRKGIQLSRKLGFPTINVDNDMWGKDEYGAYIVNHIQYGDGIAFVMPSLAEIHFFNNIFFNDNTINVKIIRKINPPSTGVLHHFYKGLENI
ncbi:MAG: riboflavin kinase [Bacteroidia bacterium]|nr:riboflavin kinase [Bacteroidia bacterium]